MQVTDAKWHGIGSGSIGVFPWMEEEEETEDDHVSHGSVVQEA